MTSPGPCLLTVDSCFSLPLYFPWFVSGFLKQRGQDTSVDKQPLERQWTPPRVLVGRRLKHILCAKEESLHSDISRSLGETDSAIKVTLAHLSE